MTAFLLSACQPGVEDADEAADDDDAPAIPVETATPTRGDIVAVYSGTAPIEAFADATLGYDALTNLVVTFDQANKRVRIVRVEGQAARLLETAAELKPLSGEGLDLKAAFNADKGKTRLLVIVSPT